MKMKFPGRLRPPACGVRPRESDFEVLARRSLLEQMAGTFFVIYSHFPRILLFLFFRSFFFLSLTRILTFSRTRMRDNMEKNFAHVLPNCRVIARISNVKYAFEMKKRVFGFTFQLIESDSAVNRRIERSFDNIKFFVR